MRIRLPWQHITIHTGRYRWAFRHANGHKGVIATPLGMVSWL